MAAPNGRAHESGYPGACPPAPTRDGSARARLAGPSSTSVITAPPAGGLQGRGGVQERRKEIAFPTHGGPKQLCGIIATDQTRRDGLRHALGPGFLAS